MNINADIKAIIYSRAAYFDDWFSLPHTGGTVLDIYAHYLLITQPPYNSGTRESEILNRTVYNMLEKAGGEFTKPFRDIDNFHPLYRCEHFKYEIQELLKFPEMNDCTFYHHIFPLFGFAHMITVFGYDKLIPLIIEKSEGEFLQTLSKRPSSVHHFSEISGLSPQHFAVTWPVGLKHLIQRHADINIKDRHGRRPIHLAIALKAYESIQLLLEADCALPPYQPGKTVIHLALKAEFPAFSLPLRPTPIVATITKAYINRYKRLKELARSVLSLEQAQRLQITGDHIYECDATTLHEMVSACGIQVPHALELGTSSVYDISGLHEHQRMAPETASTLWEGGFVDISRPMEQGLSPMLQNWHSANFEMVQWFIDKGVSPNQRHRDANIGALHLYAERIKYPGRYFHHAMENVPSSPLLISHLQDWEANRDDCRCLCSPAGCSPVTFVVRDADGPAMHGAFETFAAWVRKTSLLTDNEALWNEYARDLVRILAFEWICSQFSDLEHTCCSLNQLGGLRSKCTHGDTSSSGSNKGEEIHSNHLPSAVYGKMLVQIMEIYNEWRVNNKNFTISLPWDFMEDATVKTRYEKLIDKL